MYSSVLRSSIWALALSLMLVACGDRSGEGSDSDTDPTNAPTVQTQQSRLFDVEFDPELSVDLEASELRPSGLFIQILEEGSGPSTVRGDSVVVHYAGWRSDGAWVHASRDLGDGSPFGFRLGGGNVLPGWEEGVLGMQVGEKRKLILPPELAYGSQQVGTTILPNSILIYDVELLKIHPEG